MLDIDRDRQRISLGLKQTQEDPWQRSLNTYGVGDVLEGKVTKVVAFGAFVEILPGVEGLVHISELAEHHVENPREVVQPGRRASRVKILEIDEERRRLSLSLKRVEGQACRYGGELAAAEADERRRAPRRRRRPLPRTSSGRAEVAAEAEPVPRGGRGRGGGGAGDGGRGRGAAAEDAAAERGSCRGGARAEAAAEPRPRLRPARPTRGRARGRRAAQRLSGRAWRRRSSG